MKKWGWLGLIFSSLLDLGDSINETYGERDFVKQN
jgi:hypothetical protein